MVRFVCFCSNVNDPLQIISQKRVVLNSLWGPGTQPPNQQLGALLSWILTGLLRWSWQCPDFSSLDCPQYEVAARPSTEQSC